MRTIGGSDVVHHRVGVAHSEYTSAVTDVQTNTHQTVADHTDT
jgi:hypothetical protein